MQEPLVGSKLDSYQEEEEEEHNIIGKQIKEQRLLYYCPVCIHVFLHAVSIYSSNMAAMRTNK